MGNFDFAIEELEATGWSTVDPSGMRFTPAGRGYPGIDRVKQEFTATGRSLTMRRMDLFDCYRAEWTNSLGHAEGAVVGQSEEEAAVYALARLRNAGQRAPTA